MLFSYLPESIKQERYVFRKSLFPMGETKQNDFCFYLTPRISLPELIYPTSFRSKLVIGMFWNISLQILLELLVSAAVNFVGMALCPRKYSDAGMPSRGRTLPASWLFQARSQTSRPPSYQHYSVRPGAPMDTTLKFANASARLE